MTNAIRVPERGLTSAADIIHRTGVGASEIAAVLGISPFFDAWEVWARLRGMLGPMKPDVRMRCGKAFQQPIAQLFTEDTGLPHEWYDKPYYHPRREWQRASVDAFIPAIAKPSAVLEVKTSGLERSGDWERPEPGEFGDESGVPEYYLAQVQYQMNAHNLPLAYIAVEINHELRYYRVEADPTVQAFLLNEAEEFWRKYALGGEEPPIGHSEEFRRYLKRAYPKPKAPIREAIVNEKVNEIALLDEYAALRAELKPKLDRRDELEDELKNAVKDAAGIEWVRGVFTYLRTRDKQEVNWEKLARAQIESFPADVQREMIAEYAETTPGYRKIHFKEFK